MVADEVRNLAIRSAQAARDTSELVEGTLKRVHTGGGIASETNSVFVEVTEQSDKIGKLIGEIARICDDESFKIRDLSNAVATMDKVTKNNAADAEESASASEQMKAQARRIRSFIDELSVLTGTKM